MIFKTWGKLQYYESWLVCYVDDELAKYYRRLLPKAWHVQPQAYPAHITVVRKGIEKVKPDKLWGQYNKMSIKLTYENVVRSDNLYFWLNAWSASIGQIRQELGLPFYRFGFKNYHISIGNKKHENINSKSKT